MKKTTQFHIRPARPEEAGLFYTPHPEEDKRLGTVGHVRMDFGRSGNEFWHTWWPRGPEELNSPVFKAELQQVVDTLRESVLKSRFAMERFCYEHGGKIAGGYVQNYTPTLVTTKKRRCKQVLFRVILLPSRHKTVVFQRFPRTRPTFSGLASQWRVLPSGSKPFRSFPCAHSAVRGGFGYPCSFKAAP